MPVPVKTKNCNGILRGNDGDVFDLNVTWGKYDDGVAFVESAWKFPFVERLRILFSGIVIFRCMGRTHPPIMLDTRSELDKA